MPKWDKGYIDWDEGREGYVNRPPVAYAPVQRPAAKPVKQQQHFLSINWEERIASLIAAAGAGWSVYVATQDYSSLWRVQINPPGPLEVCALGILFWLHAKWRRASQFR